VGLGAVSTHATDRAVVLTTDYSSSASVASLDVSANTVTPNHLAVHTDAAVRTHGGKVYVLERLGRDNVLVLDGSDLSTPVLQFSVGNGSNPQDIAFVDGTKAYVSRYELDRLLIVNPATGDSLGSVDISFAADADGVPEMSQLAIHEGQLFVVCQRLDRDGGWVPSDRSEVVVVDVSTDQVVDVDASQAGVQGIVLGLRNPADAVQREGRLYVSCVGSYADLTDGGIEVVDLSARATGGVVVGEEALGGNLASLAMVSDGIGYVVVADASYANSVVRVDLLTRRVTGVFSDASGGSIADVGVLGDRVYVLDRGSWGAPKSAVWVYGASDNALLAGPLSTDIPPVAVAFYLRSGSPSTLAADFDGDGTVGFTDFLMFAGAFDSSRGDANYQAVFDLDGDGSIVFADFLVFAADFGKSR